MTQEINILKEPSKFAVNFANTIFFLGILFSVLITIFAIYKIYNSSVFVTNTFYIFSVVFGIIFATLFSLGLRLNDNLKVNLSVLILTVGIVVYIFEIYLEFSEKKILQDLSTNLYLEKAKKLGIPYDTRTPIEVMNDLNKSGIKVYSNFFPRILALSNDPKIINEQIFPLGGISNITTIFANESGYYPIIETDEHGFNNPKGLYKKNEVDIVLTGDSFTEGLSVHSNENIAAVLRESDFNTISLGKINNGPLIEFAALKEYGKPLQPKVVLWLYHENDLYDLNYEMSSPFLMKYLNEVNFSQNLIARQNEINNLLLNFFQEKSKENKEVKKKIKINSTIKFLKLTSLRNKIKLQPNSKKRPEAFKIILEKSKKLVSEWDGILYFVFLPSYYRYYQDEFAFNLMQAKKELILNREFVLHTAAELEIPIIDIHEQIFVPHSDQLSLFPFKMFGHYNAKGYRLIAETISERLAKDGIIPLKLNK